MLESFGLAPEAPPEATLGEAAAALLARLRDGASTADELVRAAGIDPAAASSALIELEIAGTIALEAGVYRAAV